MGMTIDEIMYRLQAMTTMCTFQDAVGHDLSQKEIKLYNQAKDEAIKTMRKYQKIAQLYDYWRSGKCEYTILCMENIGKVLRDGNDD